MTDESDLIRNVCMNPADDTPRLIYADWLDDHGQHEKSEYIRLQIEMEEMKAKYNPISPLPLDHPAHGNWMRLVRREMDLWPAVRTYYRSMIGQSWAINSDCVLPPDENAPMVAVVSRGFPAEVTLPMAVFLGGECRQCGPSGYRFREQSSKVCQSCHSTGQTPGIAKELFEKWPITKVTITNGLVIPTRTQLLYGRLPLGWTRDTEKRVYSFGGSLLNISEQALMRMREVDVSRLITSERLNAAALDYGRKLANLPPLK